MTNWIEYYDKVSLIIDDDILDDLDTIYGVKDNEDLPNEYFVEAAMRYHARITA